VALGNVAAHPSDKYITLDYITLDAYDTSGNVVMHLTGVMSATRITLGTKVSDLI
jgi:hypothetical protein